MYHLRMSKKKSKILTNWLQKVSVNEEAVNQLEMNSLRHEEMESRIIIIDILSNIVNQTKENEKKSIADQNHERKKRIALVNKSYYYVFLLTSSVGS